jgi:hypothetical protein
MSLKAADGVVEERWRLIKYHVARPTMAAAPAIPPTITPAIVPTSVLVELGADVVESPVAVAEELVEELVKEGCMLVKEAVKVVEKVIVVVDCTLVAVDSGRSPVICAALGSNPLPVTFKYAQFGTLVPEGMSIGYCRMDIWEQLELQEDQDKYEPFWQSAQALIIE